MFMNIEWEFIRNAVFIGVGATMVMDLWALIQKRCFGVPSLNYAMVGRWIGHFPQGRFIHQNISQSSPIPAERAIGWSAHYAIGIIFAALLLAISGPQPTLTTALLFGIISVAAPFFILQPGMGAGIAAAKTPQPTIARLRSLIAHTSFGVGLYLAAKLLAQLVY
ncbi:DUF2938 domain-containing protein [Yersinia kristensenii]|uniref:DUF2938 domain-containing protein n=1 Tax=Yersinia kristensenii TaxID=28152 RepID=UPI0001A5495B|nr:hypothetical protein ykris0001_21570 [Yersinia kristensenii ATCC 33638]EEP93385.1 hypothetical protein ykris0001_35160 [Yersinia kristensenii ATCC 33638]PEH55668.1 DUF2938 domain-containing protein [Yersinia kristensenii]